MTIKEIENSAKHCAKLGKDWVELDKDKFEWLIKELDIRLKHYEMAKSARDTIEHDTATECAEIAGKTSKVAEHRIKERFNL